MTVIEKKKALATLASYTDGMEKGPVIVTEGGKPVAVLMPVVNADLETVSLSTNRQFIGLIQQSRARVRTEGGVPSKEMRRRLTKPRPQARHLSAKQRKEKTA